MSARFVYEGRHLSSIHQINALPQAVKHALYRSLIPERILTEPDLTRQTLDGDRPLSIKVGCPESSLAVEIDVRHPCDPRDPMLYVQMADTANGQIEVLLMVANDPWAPRFDVDVDWEGEATKFGTLARNVQAEVLAMRAGLAPGQVRRGLRLSREVIPVMERFTIGLGKDRFFIQPLAYHNAILFERYGFAYVIGQARMQQIHRGFLPGGELFKCLDGSTPFRMPGAERSIRGRSWAIHDGILGEPWPETRMYKCVGRHAGVCTFPNAVY
jgi:hypothetical protein